MRRALLLLLVYALAALASGCADSTDADSSPSSGERWAEEDGFNPDEEDYSDEASDLDCSEVDGPVEIDPEDDVNNLDRDGDGLACEWS